MAVSWKDFQRHPLSAEYKDITGPAWNRFCLKFKRNGFLAGYPIILCDGMVLDGWQRLRACIETGIEPKFEPLPEGTDPAEYVESVNDERRHESAEEREARIVARQERVAQARSEGKSIRTIAEEEGVASSTIKRDIDEKNVTVPRGTVTGKDGREQPSEKPQVPIEEIRCVSCRRRIRKQQELPKRCTDCAVLRKEAKAEEARKRAEGAKETVPISRSTVDTPPVPLCARCKEFGERVVGCTACEELDDNPPPPPPEPEPVVMDSAGTVVPMHLIRAANTRKLRKKFAAQLNAAAKTAKEIEESPAREAKPLDPKKPFMRFYPVLREARARNKDLDFELVCDLCEGGDDCKKCRGKGWLTAEEARHAAENK